MRVSPSDVHTQCIRLVSVYWVDYASLGIACSNERFKVKVLTKFKLPLAMRLEVRKKMRRWRARNPERDREIKRRYYENRKRQLFAEERKAKEAEK